MKAHLKSHLVYCKSLPQGVREVLDHAAVRGSRAEQGRYGRENSRDVYRRFYVANLWRHARCVACLCEAASPI